MLKLLIVDDERLDMEGLQRQLNWKAYNISEVYTAQNGKVALEIIKNKCPNILISDIKMPGITGLQLAEQAKEILPELKVIFVSGYDDFSYVKSAIKINAYEYILKPVDTDELAASVQKAVADIAGESFERQVKHQLECTVNESRPLLRNKFLLDLIFGTADRDNLLEKIQQLELKIGQGSQKVLLLEIDDFNLLKDSSAETELYRKQELLLEILQNIPCEKCLVERVQVEEHRIALIFSFREVEGESHLNAVITDIAQQIIEKVFEKAKISVTIGSGKFVSEPSELYKSYDESARAILCKIYKGKGKVLHYDNKASEADLELPNDWIDAELTKCMLSFDTARVEHLLNSMFDKFEAEKIPDSKYIQNYCINIISRVQILCHDLNVKIEDIFGPGIILWEKLMKFETILDIRQWMKNILGIIIEYLKMKNECRNSKIIDEVQNYIEIHYKDEISLRAIAEKFLYTPNYLGSMFKQEVGQGFGEYLMRYRIKRAGELLEDPIPKIYEVAAQVGYKDIPTFIKNFKTVFGMTPTEYRERCR